jgi:3-hydroxyisobutyrate dehydrogenase-like beta-hydroxyacid dehydrogenase
MTKKKVGILNPGMMGISVAATIQNSGHDVLWASEKRSKQSITRAKEHNLIDIMTLEALCQQCEALVSVCPPHAAAELADDVIAQGFKGLYVDANAIAPQKAKRIGKKMKDNGVAFVDGGIIGGPAWQAGRTWLYLSGDGAGDAEALFASGPLETEIISEEIGNASALKMCFAANSKGTTALLSAIMAAAETLGVRDALERQWSRGNSEFATQTQNRVQQVTAKAWRFAGEMEEIAATLEDANLPSGFHDAAGDIYRRMAHFKDAPGLPQLIEVLNALLDNSEQ